MTSAATKLKEAKQRIEEAKKTIKETAKDVFKELTAELFEENQNLVSFSWTQYTPYWNDGDVCEFDANIDYPSVKIKTDGGKIVRFNDYETVEVDEDEIEYEVEDTEKYDRMCEKLVTKVAKILKNFDNDDFKMMFGDHVEVTVDRNGKVRTSEYEHE
jgi:hypothetical protein